MRLNLIHWVRQLLTTDVRQIRGDFGKNAGRCALGLCIDDMVKINPKRWARYIGLGCLGVTDKIMGMSTGSSIESFLEINYREAHLAVTANDEEKLTFKEIGMIAIDQILTDEEREFIGKLQQVDTPGKIEAKEELQNQ